MKKIIVVLCSLLALSAVAGISIEFSKKSKLDESMQTKVIAEIKKQCPFMVQNDIVATSTGEKVKDGVISLTHNVHVPNSEEGETEITITIDKKKIVIQSDTDFCRK